MSEQKQAHVAASINKGMVVGANRSRRHVTHIKAALIIVCIVVAVVVLSWVGYEIIRQHDKNKAKSSVYAPHFSSISDAETAAANASASGNFSHALIDLQSVISISASKQEESDLYLQLATAAQNMSNGSLAIQYYQKRHDIDPTTAGPDAESLGRLYQQIGNKSQAIAQYQLYLSYFEAHSQSLPPYTPESVTAPIQAQIQALEDNK